MVEGGIKGARVFDVQESQLNGDVGSMVHDGRRTENRPQVSVLKWWTHAIMRHDCEAAQAPVRGPPAPFPCTT